MKFLISGDPHIKKKNLELGKEYFEFMLKIQQIPEIEYVLILGDLFDTHSVISSEVMNLWIDYLEKSLLPHFLLVGNHDKVSPSSDIHALSALRNIDNVVIVEDCWQNKDGICMVSHKASIDDFQKSLKVLNSNGILFCHQTFQGAQFENGFYAPDGTPPRLVKDFKLVIAGDVHKQQEFANIWYVGTPMAHTFNDAGEKKGVWLFDTITMHRKFIETPFPEYKIQHFYATDEAINWLKKQNFIHHYKLIVQAPKSAIQAMQTSKEYKKLKKDYHFVLYPKYSDINYTKESKISDTLSPEKMVEKYIKDVMNTELNRDTLIEMSHKFLKDKNNV